MRFAFVLATAAACGSPRPPPSSHPPTTARLRDVPAGELHSVGDFAVFTDRAERSVALFMEVERVLTHPRCINCHPAGETPHQGMEMMLHDPPVVRGPQDRGVAGMECVTCHQDRNQDLTRVPGAPKWHLAPIEMAWVDKSPAYICNQIKDPARNGHKTLQQLVDHNAHDELVAWGWSPGANREKAPGTQQQFGELTAAWVATGAECPREQQGAREQETKLEEKR